MRALLLILTLVVASDAMAERKAPVRPTIGRQGPMAKSWSAVARCLAAFGEVTLLRSTTTEHVALVGADRDDGGAYLYVMRAGSWMLSGSHAPGGVLRSFETITIGKHPGYHLEFQQFRPMRLALDDASLVPATMATTVSVYGSGPSSVCTAAMTACDVMVRGRAYRTFRGTATIDGTSEITVVGDRSISGECAPSEHLALDWPAT